MWPGQNITRPNFGLRARDQAKPIAGIAPPLHAAFEGRGELLDLTA